MSSLWMYLRAKLCNIINHMSEESANVTNVVQLVLKRRTIARLVPARALTGKADSK